MPLSNLTSKSAYISLAAGLPVFLLVICYGDWQTAFASWICAGSVFLVIQSRWELNESPWFWVSIAICLPLQIPFILYIPWDRRGVVGIAVLPVGLVDFAIMIGIVKLGQPIENRNKKKDPETHGAP
jgi:hypothetical protein